MRTVLSFMKIHYIILLRYCSSIVKWDGRYFFLLQNYALLRIGITRVIMDGTLLKRGINS